MSLTIRLIMCTTKSILRKTENINSGRDFQIYLTSELFEHTIYKFYKYLI